MPIFVSEPGRPIGTRLPEVLRGRRVDAVDETSDTHASRSDQSGSTDAVYLNAQQATVRRAVAEYGETTETEPETQRAYLPVSRICTPALFTLPASATMANALAEMDEHGIHHLVIIAEDAVAGLVDLRWVLAWIHKHAADTTSQSFTQIELPAFLTATPETDAHQLARLMLAHQLNAALVVDRSGDPTGIVTSSDYLRLYAEASRQEGSV